MKRSLCLLGFILGSILGSARLMAQIPPVTGDTEFRIKLLSQISTDTSRKGDKITAQIISPEQYSSYFMEGKIRTLKKGKGKSTLSFYFDTVDTEDHSSSLHVRSNIKYVVNSKGKSNVDEEGTVVKKTNNLAKGAIATGIGAAIGAALGGGQGALIGAGAGAAAAVVFIQFEGVKATRITFAPGSEFVMSVSKP